MTTPDSVPQNGPSPLNNEANRDTAAPPAAPYAYACREPEPAGFAAYQPTPAQAERADHWRRFTRLYVILPLSILSGVVLILAIFLLYLAVWPVSEQTRPFLSAAADILVIIFLLVVTFFFALILAGIFGAGFAYRRYWRRKPDSPLKKYGYIRILLWQIDSLVEKPIPYVNKFSENAAGLAIKINAILAYAESWLSQLTGALQKSNNLPYNSNIQKTENETD